MPLVVGIDARIAERFPDIPRARIRRAIGRYINTIAYHAAVGAADSMRHDVDGNPTGPVSEAHRKYAARRVASALARLERGLPV